MRGSLIAGGAHIARIGGEVAEFALQARGPGVERAVAKGAVDAAEVESADHVAGRERGHVLLVAIHIHDGVGRNGLGVAGGEDVHALRRVDVGQLRGRDLKPVMDGRVGRGEQARIDRKGRGAGEEVILPDIRRNDGDAAAGVGGTACW